MSLSIDTTAVNRIKHLRTAQGRDGLRLRVRVEGGGCSGFQYKLEMTEDSYQNDTVFEGVVVTDDISLPFLDGSIISFEDGLIGSEFKINNPNAVSGCGCGTSFSVI